MEERYEFREGTSAKFWAFEVSGTSLTTLWGRIGTDGQRKVKEYPDEEAAITAGKKAATAKMKKGYVRAGDPDTADDSNETATDNDEPFVMPVHWKAPPPSTEAQVWQRPERDLTHHKGIALSQEFLSKLSPRRGGVHDPIRPVPERAIAWSVLRKVSWVCAEAYKLKWDEGHSGHRNPIWALVSSHSAEMRAAGEALLSTQPMAPERTLDLELARLMLRNSYGGWVSFWEMNPPAVHEALTDYLVATWGIDDTIRLMFEAMDKLPWGTPFSRLRELMATIDDDAAFLRACETVEASLKAKVEACQVRKKAGGYVSNEHIVDPRWAATFLVPLGSGTGDLERRLHALAMKAATRDFGNCDAHPSGIASADVESFETFLKANKGFSYYMFSGKYLASIMELEGRDAVDAFIRLKPTSPWEDGEEYNRPWSRLLAHFDDDAAFGELVRHYQTRTEEKWPFEALRLADELHGDRLRTFLAQQGVEIDLDAGSDVTVEIAGSDWLVRMIPHDGGLVALSSNGRVFKRGAQGWEATFVVPGGAYALYAHGGALLGCSHRQRHLNKTMVAAVMGSSKRWATLDVPFLKDEEILSALLTDDAAFLAGNKSIWRSTDGIEWARTNVSLTKYGKVLKLGALSAQTLLAVTYGGAILRSDNGGKKWTCVHTTASPLTRVVARSEMDAVVVGDDDTVLRTEDGGLTWTEMKAGTGADIECACLTNDGRYLAVTRGGHIIASEDGSEWATLRTFHSKFTSVCTTPEGEIVCGGDDGEVLRISGLDVEAPKKNTPPSPWLDHFPEGSGTALPDYEPLATATATALPDGAPAPVVEWEDDELEEAESGSGRESEWDGVSLHKLDGEALEAFVSHRERWAIPTGPSDLLLAPVGVHDRLLALGVDGDDARYYLPAALARCGTALIPFMPSIADGDIENVEGVLLPIGDVRLAGVVIRAFAGKKNKDLAKKWLERHPEHAIFGALLVLRDGRDACGEVTAESTGRVLRFLVAQGHRATIEEVAAKLSVDVAPVLDHDPLTDKIRKKTKIPAYLKKLPDLVQKGGTVAPAAEVKEVLLRFAVSNADEPHPKVLHKSDYTEESRRAFAWAVFQSWLDKKAPAKEQWCLQTLGFWGDDQTARDLTALAKRWPGEGAAKRAQWALDALANIGTQVALTQINVLAEKSRFPAFKLAAKERMNAIARRRGLSPDELADRLAPRLDLDGEDASCLDFGTRSFTLRFDESLMPTVHDTDGKRLKKLPKANKSDDAAKAKAATARFKAIKKDAKAAASLQIWRLERAMQLQRPIALDVFMEYFVQHPWMTHLAQRLVWERGDSAEFFRIDEGGHPVNVEDDEAMLQPGDTVRVAHPLRMGPSMVEAWSGVFADYEILQPFPQLGRQVFALEASELKAGRVERFAGMKVEPGQLLSLKKRGWRLWDSGLSFSTGPAQDAVLHFDPGWHPSDSFDDIEEQTLGALTAKTWPSAVLCSELLLDIERMRHT